MNEGKNIEELKNQLLNIFSSSIQIIPKPQIESKSLGLETPLPDTNSNQRLETSNDIPININVSVNGSEKESKEYKKQVKFDPSSRTYNIELKKNHKPLDLILNSNTQLINKISPISLINKFNTNTNYFKSSNSLTKTSNFKKSNKTKVKNTAYMSFLKNKPYSFMTGAGTYFVTNITKDQKNKNSSLESNIHNTTKNILIDNTSKIELSNTSNVLNSAPNVINNTSNVLNSAPNVINNTSNVLNSAPNVINNTSNVLNSAPNVINTNITLIKIENATQDINTINSNKNLTRIYQNDINSNNITNTNTTHNSAFINNIIEHNKQQLDSKNFKFLTTEKYITINPQLGETLNTVNKLSFHDIKSRTINRMQARTIVSNKENKIIVPAFTGGGIVDSQKIFVAREAGAETILPSKFPNETKSVISQINQAENNTTRLEPKISNEASKTIDQNLQMKEQIQSEKSIQDMQKIEDNESLNSVRSQNYVTEDVSKGELPTKPQADINLNQGGSTVDRFRRMISMVPDWRIKYM